MKQFLFFCAVFLAFYASTATGQTVSNFLPGEKLTYNLSFANFADAGSIELYSAGREKLAERDVNVVRARIRTTGIVQSTLIDLNDELTTFVEPETNLPIRVERFTVNGGKASEVRHDFAENVDVSSAADGVFDLLSAIYQIRRLDLTNTAPQMLKVWDNEKFYAVKLQVIGRENVSTPIGAFNAVAVQISTDDKTLNRHKIKVYLSEDERHLPVLISLKLPQAVVRAELVSVDFLQPEPVAVAVQPIAQPTPIVAPPLRPVPTPKPYFDNQPLDPDLPFALGEKLEFEVTRAAQKIGVVNFEARERKQFNGHDSLLLTVTATPFGNSNVFAAGNKIESYIDPNYLVPFRQEIKLKGALAGFNQTLSFDQERGAVTNDRALRTDVPVGTHDALSFIYALRAFRFSVAEKDAQNTRASVFLNNTPMIVTLKPSHQIIEFGGKKVSVILLTAIADNPQIDSLNLKLWLSDDARRLPLKFTCNTPLGAIEANLTKF